MLLFVCVLVARITRSSWLMTVGVDIIIVVSILVSGCLLIVVVVGWGYFVLLVGWCLLMLIFMMIEMFIDIMLVFLYVVGLVARMFRIAYIIGCWLKLCYYWNRFASSFVRSLLLMLMVYF